MEHGALQELSLSCMTLAVQAHGKEALFTGQPGRYQKSPISENLNGLMGIDYCFSLCFRACSTFSGVMGNLVIRIPIASSTAFARAAATGVMPNSPTPFAP